ncbi:Glutathione S-transferase domain [Parvibaculum lavamentivorans DS-1]|uniref:Glutathione S-transferase domain n=1 Tax=Parvibaculum lavamentivorans (strain DS-1 / DSM 13023 / NCIMB 13966) TaxID=402881 RepID=A7HRQ6_PARL1|nr:glutathione S-transferase family protein [Parvibaculum lavamentivorans]ABS62589.1 Glutathione S-transferase domain [Parvibaculum lavamentivorans DS-1]
MRTLSVLKWVPPFARGSVKEFRVRWALEEAGLPYEERVLTPADQDAADYRALQPFGQVPVLEEDGFELFESGAIVLRIAEKSEVLLPRDERTRAKAIQWMFAAQTSVQPSIDQVTALDFFYPEEEWAKLRRPGAEDFLKRRLGQLAGRLEGREWLEDRFTAGDLMMATVLRDLRHRDFLSGFPALAGYVKRCEARPAFQRALADHMALYAEAAKAEAAE